VRFDDDARVCRIELAGEPHQLHRLSWMQGGDTHTIATRWLIDACGRAGLLKRKLGLAEANAHDANAAWFRVAKRIDIDHWSASDAWRARCEPQARWLSTNHLVGAGYWVWLIPLASGSHSVGIVADPALHPLESIDTFDKAMRWLARYQPRLYDELHDKRHLLQDFAFFRKFSYGCKQVFSGQRWALTGEAGLFLDPFYSPGSDFIAMGNTYITDLIAHDRAGRSVEARAQLYDQIYHSFYESTLALYQDQYPLFGDPEVLPVKVLWDYTYYWGVLSQIFFHDRLCDLALLGSLKDELQHCQKLNIAMQALLRAWSAVSAKLNRAVMLDQAALPWFAELNASLNDQLDDAAFQARLRASAAQLQRLAAEIRQRALACDPTIDDRALTELLEHMRPAMPVDTVPAPMLFEAA
jgi:hypothetical protein